MVHGNPTWGYLYRNFIPPPEYLDRIWLRDFPNADVLRLPDAGHYLQEDAHERIVPKLIEHLDSVFHAVPKPQAGASPSH